MKKIFLFSLPIVLLAIVLYFFYQREAQMKKVSEFGKYQGYSDPAYDGAKRISEYLTLSDGTRVAYDLFLPMKKGVPADKPLPALFKYTPYLRTFTIFDQDGNNNATELYNFPWYMKLAMQVRKLIVPNGNLMTALARTEWLNDLVKSGYAVVVVERPGTGASFGKLVQSPEAAAKETDEVINWIAAQPWSDGKVGMYGDSWQAQIQFIAASTGNPHLKAIFAESTWMDNYTGVVFPGGIFDKGFAQFFHMSQKLLDTKLITPVDSDPEGVIVAQVRAERHGESTADIATKMEKVPYRDSLIPSEGENLWIDHQALYPLMDKINRSGVPVYLINGWYDIYARDNFLIYTNLTTPKRLMVRPTDHSNVEDAGADIAIGVEAHRWFDYWLKGIDNGIMSEPPIHYYVMNGDKSSAWHTTDTWPLPEQSVTRYYFAPALSSAANATSGSQVSANNGGLMMEAPASSPTSASAADAYTIDYTTTTGTRARWTSVEEPHKYPNMRAHDAKALTYTTPPLESALDVTGHPLVHLWLCADAGSPRNLDLDAFVYLEEVDRAGNVTYITEGLLRASHRALSPAPFASFGLPFHTHFQTDLLPVQPGEPFELVFDLLPTAYRFSPGKQLRISLAFADADNFTTPIFTPAPKVQLLHNQSHPSYMEVPVVK